MRSETKAVTLRVPVDVAEQLKRIAKRERITMSEAHAQAILMLLEINKLKETCVIDSMFDASPDVQLVRAARAAGKISTLPAKNQKEWDQLVKDAHRATSVQPSEKP